MSPVLPLLGTISILHKCCRRLGYQLCHELGHNSPRTLNRVNCGVGHAEYRFIVVCARFGPVHLRPGHTKHRTNDLKHFSVLYDQFHGRHYKYGYAKRCFRHYECLRDVSSKKGKPFSRSYWEKQA